MGLDYLEDHWGASEGAGVDVSYWMKKTKETEDRLQDGGERLDGT